MKLKIGVLLTWLLLVSGIVLILSQHVAVAQLLVLPVIVSVRYLFGLNLPTSAKGNIYLGTSIATVLGFALITGFYAMPNWLMYAARFAFISLCAAFSAFSFQRDFKILTCSGKAMNS